ncbi:PREDICTED: CASP-like protein 2C1 [Tarenaya hassleriana]|uniref:CASP-like protein 2C1 n=1 Tax=Tarenaya hassleriana TaxID=28532 RepID=UPI00053C2DA4|nr:PREDICTED: CASP-like protein 2C1 [Tarenaya hassleriana]
MGMKMRMRHLTTAEAAVRLSVALILLLTACLIGFDSQTRIIAYYHKKVTFRVLKSLEIGMYIDAAAAAYNLLQLGYLWFRVKQQKDSKSVYVPWLCYILDQTAAYAVYAGTCAAAENSLLVVRGSKELQWMEWCSKYTRFCFQVGGAVVCSFLAAALMTLLSALSAFRLFRLYSPSRFLLLKSTISSS